METTTEQNQKTKSEDTFCLTCGIKNCPKVDWCPGAELEEDDDEK